MFRELMPLIKTRPLTITVAVEGDSRVRLNVVPKPIAKDKAANDKIGHTHSKEVAPIPDEAIHALTTPLSITGTPEEVDAGLCEALTKFAASHQTLQQSFDDAAANIANAVKAIDERERIKKEKDKAANKKATTAASTKAEEPTKAESGLPLLFTAPANTAVSTNDATPPAANEASSQPSQSESEIEEGDE
jgi:PRTRC genetic system protein E